jgi:4-hydroxyphenylpyruvate dioxygenase-like putative hemolysin
MSEEAIFKKTLQIGLVVESVDEAVKGYEELGLGPWNVFNLEPSNFEDTTVHGKKQEFSFRVGFAVIGGLEFELIEPLDDKSIYSEFLKEKGPGLHHLAFEVDDFGKTVDILKGKGVDIIQGGRVKDSMGFAYLGTEKQFNCITEIYDKPKTE